MTGVAKAAYDLTGRALTVHHQRWLVLVLTLVSMLAMVDKNLIQLMVGSIKRDIGLTDVQISVLLGAAFALANVATSLPAGWLADRVGRRKLIGGGIVLWSAATVAGGLASSFATLFAARAVVGCGEGLVPPASYSLISDGVPRRARGRALAVYSMATTAGAAISLIVCGALIGAIVSHGVKAAPLIGPIRPWQLALVIIGLVGLPMPLLLLTLPIVRRKIPLVHETETTFRDVLRMIWSRKGLFLPLLIYSVMHSMIMATNGSWVPALTERKFHMAPQAFGPIMGGLLLIFGPGGLWLAGTAIDRLQRRGRPAAAIVALVGAVAFMLTTVAMAQARTFTGFLTVEAICMLSTSTFLVVTSVIVSTEAPANMVGKTISLFLFLQGLAGPALAPTVAAYLSDHVFMKGPNALGNAITTVGACCGIIGIAMAATLFRNMARGQNSPPSSNPSLFAARPTPESRA